MSSSFSQYTWNGDRLWRKNRRVNPGSSCMGVDINRNYNDHWGGVSCVNAPFTPLLASGEKDRLTDYTVSLAHFSLSLSHFSLSDWELKLRLQWSIPWWKCSIWTRNSGHYAIFQVCNISSSAIIHKATIHNNIIITPQGAEHCHWSHWLALLQPTYPETIR